MSSYDKDNGFDSWQRQWFWLIWNPSLLHCLFILGASKYKVRVLLTMFMTLTNHVCSIAEGLTARFLCTATYCTIFLLYILESYNSRYIQVELSHRCWLWKLNKPGCIITAHPVFHPVLSRVQQYFIASVTGLTPSSLCGIKIGSSNSRTLQRRQLNICFVVITKCCSSVFLFYYFQLFLLLLFTTYIF